MKTSAPTTSTKLALSLSLGLFLLSASGCSVFMAAKQPPKKDLNVLTQGNPRALVLSELGQPLNTETKDGRRVDVFTFVQGYSKGAKAGRAFFHGAADILTVGLWEVVGTPTEATFDGKKMSVEITYDPSDRVDKVNYIQK